MSNQPGTTTVVPAGNGPSLDEAQLNQAMKRLKLLHIKV